MFSVRETPWHKQGIVLDAPPSTDEALKAAKLDWRVHKVPLHIETDRFLHNTDGSMVRYNNEPVQRMASTEFYATVRYGDDGTPHILGQVSARYAVLQNTDAFKVFDQILLPEGFTYETAGAIKGGKRVWILAKGPEGLVVGDEDALDRFVLLVTSHDGSMNVRLMPTATRVVCNNTLTWALKKGENDGFSIRHTGDVNGKVSDASQALLWANGSFKDAVDVWNRMYEYRIPVDVAQRFFLRVVPKLADRETVDGKPNTWQKAFNDIAECYLYGRGNKGETLWDAYQALAEWIDHKKNTAADRAVDYAFFGEGGKIKQRAFDIAREVLADEVVFPTTEYAGVN
jgi:phage/plasmid-like protein (TIGR03299 family)